MLFYANRWYALCRRLEPGFRHHLHQFRASIEEGQALKKGKIWEGSTEEMDNVYPTTAFQGSPMKLRKTLKSPTRAYRRLIGELFVLQCGPTAFLVRHLWRSSVYQTFSCAQRVSAASELRCYTYIDSTFSLLFCYTLNISRDRRGTSPALLHS